MTDNYMIYYIIIAFLFLTNIISLASLIYFRKKGKNNNGITISDDVKFTKVNEEDDNMTAIDEILDAMQKEIDSSKQDAVELFEQEQEEKAIISYQELLDAKNKNNNKYYEENESKNPEEELVKGNKFVNSDFVSPVFGKIDNQAIATSNPASIEVSVDEKIDPHELEKTLNIDPLTEEIKKNSEFLSALKEFRKNL